MPIDWNKLTDMAIYVKSSFSVSTLYPVTIPKCFEFIASKIFIASNNSTVVIGVYMPLSADANSIDADLSQYVNSELIILDDFNIDQLCRASDYLKVWQS